MLREGAESVIDAGTSTATLAYCLISVLMTASDAALVADIAVHEYRRKAVVEAGRGQVVDQLLKVVATVDAHVCLVSQAESARTLAYLLSDESTCEDVLSRPGALSLLFQFASSLHAKQGSRGRSMLVIAIIDLITSSCDAEIASVRPKLPKNADPEDIAAALQVAKDGGWHDDDQNLNDSDSPRKIGNNRKGVHGIEIRVLGGTALTACVSRSKPAQSLVFHTGLPVLREIANESEVNSAVQGALAQLLDVLTAEEDGPPEAVAYGKLGHVKTKRHGHASSEAKSREVDEASPSGTDLVLYKRIADMKAEERRKAVEEIIYALIIHKFVEADVNLVQTLPFVSDTDTRQVEILPTQDKQLEIVQSAEALKMVREHLAVVSRDRGTSTSLDQHIIAHISKLRVGQLSIVGKTILTRVECDYSLADLSFALEMVSDSIGQLANIGSAVAKAK
ncbi:hypothetical protein MARPO_0017s0011 [Marchantia polymorpha]|uniref:Uncharacterized protein n=1 Tax=Marchantia polymorpha TaxID=3197 RepID=A0A2R6XFK5_MARPO|nr:hypothetical protein MARPO_0017s0011 [Marchantia polymorpha]|eukprot:PTQ44886.1 hypothetical protein MARPO_0017s0011 [Marchantia polymorpha]